MLLFHSRALCSRAVSTSALLPTYGPRKHVFKLAGSHFRCLSTKDVFGGADYSNLDVPPIPIPPTPKPSIEELYASGKSVLSELGLFQWYTPPSYLRWLMESLHDIPLPFLDMNLPWWSAIVLTTCTLRILSLPVLKMSRKNMYIMQQNKKELEDFEERMRIAKAEGNNLLVQQILMDRLDFNKSIGMKTGRQLMSMLVNGAIFFCQFRAVKLLSDYNYPGLNTGGMLWFHDLTQTDMILPVIAAVTMHLAFRTGLETGGAKQHILMKMGMLYGVPALIVLGNFGLPLIGMEFPAAVWMHWISSFSITLAYAGLFTYPAFCKLVKTPYLHKLSTGKNEWVELMEWYKTYRAEKKTIRSGSLRLSDAKEFENAGRKYPVKK